MTELNRRQVLGGGVALGAMAVAAPGLAQSFPTRPVTFICPFPAGGIVDLVMRSFSEDLAAELGQPVAVDVRPGASGMVAASAVAAAEPDGHTIMLVALSHLTAPLFSPVAHDPVNDFRPFAQVSTSVGVVAVPASLGVSTLDEFLELARSRPGELNYLKPGIGSFGHLTMEALQQETGISVEGIEYAGLPPGIVDMLAGRLDVGVMSAVLAQPHVQEGTMQVLATVGDVRSPLFPDLPTLSELGHDDANISPAYLALAPAATPEPVIERLHEAFATVLAREEVQERLLGVGTLPLPALSLDELQARMRADSARFTALVESLGN